MKTYIQPGDTVTITAPANVSAGQLVRVGVLAGVAVTTALSGQPVEIMTNGVADVTKAGSQAWTVGAAIYGTGTTTLTATTATTTGNILLGVAVAAVGAGAGETTGRIRLNGSAPAALT
ncbi:MAG: capsid cement protein [bacterium]|jgi:predicted RecA/RadA family phage recombinase